MSTFPTTLHGQNGSVYFVSFVVKSARTSAGAVEPGLPMIFSVNPLIKSTFRLTHRPCFVGVNQCASVAHSAFVSQGRRLWRRIHCSFHPA
jgi:hypothetical protein